MVVSLIPEMLPDKVHDLDEGFVRLRSYTNRRCVLPNRGTSFAFDRNPVANRKSDQVANCDRRGLDKKGERVKYRERLM